MYFGNNFDRNYVPLDGMKLARLESVLCFAPVNKATLGVGLGGEGRRVKSLLELGLRCPKVIYTQSHTCSHILPGGLELLM